MHSSSSLCTADFVEGFEAKLIKLSDDTVGSITTEDGVTIKKVKFENVGFDMTYVAVHEDDFEAKVTMEVGSYFGKGEMLLGDCPRPLTDVEEEKPSASNKAGSPASITTLSAARAISTAWSIRVWSSFASIGSKPLAYEN